MPTETFAERMGRLRLAAGLTQEQLAQRLDLPTRTVANWERGYRMPSITAAPALADALGVSCDVLLAGLTPTRRETKSPGRPGPRARLSKDTGEASAEGKASDQASKGKASQGGSEDVGPAPAKSKTAGRQGKKKGS